MVDLVSEITEMLDEIIEKYEDDTSKSSSHEKMISGLIRNKHYDLFGE